jgi:ParB family chromosome partitioning protein
MTDLLSILTAAERLAITLLAAHGTLKFGRRTDDTERTIHVKVAEALTRKGLVTLFRRKDSSSATLTEDGRAAARGLSATPQAAPVPKAAPRGEAEPSSPVRLIPLDCIYANPNQPRTIFKDSDLDELGASIREHGLLQPITVRPDGEGRYMIVLGERRWRAHARIDAETILATVATMTDDDLADAAIVENLQRKDITPLEEARAFQRRLETGLTVDELAKRLGMKQPWRITERTNLLRLSEEHQQALVSGILNPSQALEMSRLTPPSQRRLFEALRTGKCRSFEELRRTTQALLDAERQGDLWNRPEPSDEEKKTVYRLEQKIERVCEVLRAGFQDNEVVVLRRVNPLNADVLADKLDVIETSLKKLRLALRAAAVAGAQEGAAA